jgi:hypothetical protein
VFPALHHLAIGSADASVQASRRAVAGLITDVLSQAITPRQAINRWPTGQTAQRDPSLICVYWLLWRLESDEAEQKTATGYVDLQLQALAVCQHALASGQPIPETLLLRYRPLIQPIRYYKSGWDKLQQWVTRLMKWF